MSSTFDAVRTAGHDDPLSAGEVGGKLPGHMLAVGGLWFPPNRGGFGYAASPAGTAVLVS